MQIINPLTHVPASLLETPRGPQNEGDYHDKERQTSIRGRESFEKFEG